MQLSYQQIGNNYLGFMQQRPSDDTEAANWLAAYEALGTTEAGKLINRMGKNILLHVEKRWEMLAQRAEQVTGAHI